VGHHDGAGLGTDCLSEPICDRVIGAELDVDHDGGEAVLNNRVDGRGKARGNGQYLISALEGPLAKLVAGETAERDEVGARSAVYEDGAAGTDVPGESAFKQRMEPPGGQPAVEGCINERCEVLWVEYLARNWNSG